MVSCGPLNYGKLCLFKILWVVSLYIMMICVPLHYGELCPFTLWWDLSLYIMVSCVPLQYGELCPFTLRWVASIYIMVRCVPYHYSEYCPFTLCWIVDKFIYVFYILCMCCSFLVNAIYWAAHSFSCKLYCETNVRLLRYKHSYIVCFDITVWKVCSQQKHYCCR